MMGRITAIEALSTDYRHVLVASASGGVFKSLNGGITWDPIFDNSGGAGSIGAVAMFEPDPNIIWVGTGAAANRNSSGWGDGIYKTTDGGQSWQHLGLESTHHIAEIALHPTDPDIAYAASPGHLWGYSGERGLFKTTDGGATWTKLGTGAPVATPGSGTTGGLPNDGRTGATEIIMGIPISSTRACTIASGSPPPCIRGGRTGGSSRAWMPAPPGGSSPADWPRGNRE
jgi:hypothetical protein